MKKLIVVFLVFSCNCIVNNNNNIENIEINDIQKNIQDLFFLIRQHRFNLISPLFKENKKELDVLDTLLPPISIILKYILEVDLTDYNFTYILDKEFIKEFEKQFSISSEENLELFKFYLQKLLIDSSKNKNDVSSYRECSEKYYNHLKYKNKAVFFLVRTNKMKKRIEDYRNCMEENKNSTYCDKHYIRFPSFEIINSSYSYGLCLPNININNLIYNYKILILKVVNLNKILESSALFLKECQFQELNIIKMKNLENNNEIYLSMNKYDLFSFTPLYIIIFIFLFMCFNKLPQCLFKSCFKIRKVNDKNFTLNKKPIFDKKQFNNFSKKFSLKSNWEELFNYKNKTEKINNESGLSYIKGIRGLSMIFSSFGFLFLILINSPISIYTKYDYSNLFKSILYSIFFGGLRYAPRLLLSCSGFILFYKFICYLDEKYDEQLEKKMKEYNANNNLKTKTELSLSNFHEVLTDNSFDDSKNKIDYEKLLIRQRNVNDIKFSFLIQFYFYQIHKYILYILVLSFCLFSLPILYKIESIFYYYMNIKGIILSPTWQLFIDDYINPVLNKSDSDVSSYFIPDPHNNNQNNVTSYLNLVLGYTSTYSFHYQDFGSENLLYFFWLFYNEVIFFLISTFFLFIGYKYKIGIDKFFKMIIIITILGKIIIIIFFHENFGNASLFYYSFSFGSFFVNPLYNYIYYSIGIYFGSINYIIQKRINYDSIELQEKPFLTSFIPVVNWYEEKGICMKIFNSIIVLLIISINFLYYIYSIFKDGKDFEDMVFSEFNDIFLSFDIEIIIFLTHLSCCLFYVDSNNFINQFLSNPFWSILNKLYTSFLLLLNPTILFILFQCGMRIKLNIYNCILYALISDFIAFIVFLLSYIFFELPSKRITKLIFKKSKKVIEVE